MNNQNNDLPEHFKMTELGLLAEDWETTRLGNLFEIKQGKALSPEHRRGISPGPFLRTANVFWGRLDLAKVDSMDFTDNEVSQLRLMPNDLLVCEGGDIGRTAIWRGQLDVCCYQNHLHRLRAVTDAIYPPFYMYWMQAAYLLLDLYRGTGNKTTIPNLSQSRLKSFVLPLPPLSEQKAIARVLSIIQRAIEAQDKIIIAARELKKSLMRHLFTYGPVSISEAEKMPLRETEIGPVPEHWEVVRLGELFEIKQGKALSPMHRRGISPRPFLRTANIYWGYLDLTTLDRMDFTDTETPQLMLKPNDLLVCEGGHIGRTAIWRGQLDVCCYQNHLHRLRAVKDGVYPLFYMYWMQVAYLLLRLYGGTGNKTTIPNLSQSRLKSFMLPFPPLPEQKGISISLLEIDKKISAEENSKTALQALFKTMLHLLMTGRVRVKELRPS